MRLPVCATIAALLLAAHPASAQQDRAQDRATAKFWKSAQAKCDATAAKPASELGQKIAKTAINEFHAFGGHKIDANGRLFHFGLTEAEHEEDDGGSSQATVGRLGWWEVMKYWRSLFGNEAPSKLEVRGYQDASSADKETQAAALIRGSAAQLMREADKATDPEAREMLRESALRAAVIDTSWSAAFISYVVKEAGVGPNAFQFSNAHRSYIYDAFAATAAEQAGQDAGEKAFRACPLATKPRVGDILCQHRESKYNDLSDEAARELARKELAGPADGRTIRRTHCEVVAHVDAKARKVYTIGGNANQAVTARKMNLRGRGLKLSASQKGHCGKREWTMPEPSDQAAGQSPHAAGHTEKCSLNDKKWFVLLQLR
jgi:hypothetical protein